MYTVETGFPHIRGRFQSGTAGTSFQFCDFNTHRKSDWIKVPDAAHTSELAAEFQRERERHNEELLKARRSCKRMRLQGEELRERLQAQAAELQTARDEAEWLREERDHYQAAHASFSGGVPAKVRDGLGRLQDRLLQCESVQEELNTLRLECEAQCARADAAEVELAEAVATRDDLAQRLATAESERDNAHSGIRLGQMLCNELGKRAKEARAHAKALLWALDNHEQMKAAVEAAEAVERYRGE